MVIQRGGFERNVGLSDDGRLLEVTEGESGEPCEDSEKDVNGGSGVKGEVLKERGVYLGNLGIESNTESSLIVTIYFADGGEDGINDYLNE